MDAGKVGKIRYSSSRTLQVMPCFANPTNTLSVGNVQMRVREHLRPKGHVKKRENTAAHTGGKN